MGGLLRDKSRPSCIPRLADEKVALVVRLTMEEPPPGDAAHWTVRAMVERSGVSTAMVHRIWQENGLAPHRFRQFKLSNDPAFAAKVEDVVGLYVDPPQHAVVLSTGEKSQIQPRQQAAAPSQEEPMSGDIGRALDRIQPGLPIKRGRFATVTHDYKRYGTTTLLAALDILDGTIIGQNRLRHRRQEFIQFLNVVDRQFPAGKQIHVVLDNDAAHNHAKVRAWLVRHPRWTFHCTPTACSWLNAVEGFFAKLTRRRLKRGAFHSLVDLQQAINTFIEIHNAKPKPFVWKADPKAIIAAAKRGGVDSLSKCIGTKVLKTLGGLEDGAGLVPTSVVRGAGADRDLAAARGEPG